MHLKFGTNSYVYHNIRKYEIISLLIMQKYNFLFSTWVHETAVNMQINTLSASS
jgi:hypothetical protein